MKVISISAHGAEALWTGIHKIHMTTSRAGINKINISSKIGISRIRINSHMATDSSPTITCTIQFSKKTSHYASCCVL